MRVCCLGDLHYGGSRDWLVNLANNSIGEICGDSNIAVIVGDITVSGSLDHLKEALTIIKEVLEPIPILFVPGNHDIYVTPEEHGQRINSLLKLQLFNSLVEKIGCIPLMKKPFILGNVGFVGSIGWYDYSFIPEWLGLSVEDYRAKTYGFYVWADKDYVKLPMSDEEFTLYLLNRFEEQIKEIYDKVDKVVIALHHIPFRELVHYKLRAEWDYFSTFMGSENFGYTIRKYSDKVKLVLYGHSHDGVVTRVCKEVEGIKCCNCASPIPLVLEV